jgi:hypothetical protein
MLVSSLFIADIISSLPREDQKSQYWCPLKYWEIIADNLSKAGWSWGCISSTDHEGRQFWVVTAEREDAGRFVVRVPMKNLRRFCNLKLVRNWLDPGVFPQVKTGSLTD